MKAKEETNQQLQTAWEFVEHTGKSIFLSGKAGTGKTTFLKSVVERSSKRIVVVAPTGVAAINAQGATIHSFFQLPLSPFVPEAKMPVKYAIRKEKHNLLASMDLLIIDEISMVRADLLDAIDAVLRRHRNRHKPFGGVQLLMIGDLGQLTPVVTPEDERLLSAHYDSPYFFASKALQQVNYVTIQLDTVFRQHDGRFLDILNRIRENRSTPADFAVLNERHNPSFAPHSHEGYIRLTTHNHLAKSYNEGELQKLSSTSFCYPAQIEGVFPEYAYPTNEMLELKVGAQVMFVKNDPTAEHRYYNGRIGRVVHADSQRVSVLCTGDTTPIEVEKQEWENTHYRLNAETNEIETEVQGIFRQYPLRLAWAITIHKSQGLTFDRAIIDASLSFAPGQVYVALSRCRTLEGLVLATPLYSRAVISDVRVDSYIATQEQACRFSLLHLSDFKNEYYASLLFELFDFHELLYRLERLLRVMEEYFYHSKSQLVSDFRTAHSAFLEQVMQVSEKWIRQMQTMTPAQLSDPVFLQRVSRSAAYFSQTLSSLFDALLPQAKQVETKNKQALKRYSESLTDFQQQHRCLYLLLATMAQTDFDVPTYLHQRIRCYFESVGGERKSTAKKKKEKEKKEPKPKTWELTYALFRQGHNAPSIAQGRGLTLSTIYDHLSRYVTQGELSLTDILPSVKHQAILDAIDQAGIDQGLTAIKTLCPPDVSFAEIRLVVDTLRAS